ncbi:MAG: hypothetical protein HC877_17550 [Thioploca sp.]|nr:hypothetical protein [Thioploca sp.]
MSKYISSWLVLGPIEFDNQEIDARTIIRIIDEVYSNTKIDPKKITKSPRFAPQEDEVFVTDSRLVARFPSYTWRNLKFSDIDWDNIEDISDNISQKLHPDFFRKEHVLAFFLVYIWSPECRASRLYVRADDSIRVWLNGTELNRLRFEGDQGISKTETNSDILLVSGCNILMIAVANTYERWGFSARIENDEGLKLTTEKSACVEKMLEVAGTFTLKTSDVATVTKDDFSLYDLLLEWSSISSEDKIDFHTTHFDWATNPNDIRENSIAFSFSESISLDDINADVSIKVKTFDGALVWSKDFKPKDPLLKKLKIEVPLQRPTTLSNAPKLGKNKKLRGKLLELSNKCSLKDVTVVIQAKKQNDNVWRIVGASQTDSFGNFSLPYPYGTYEKAQAITSLTPDSPADILVNPDNQNDQTISDDFLYLLIKDADCVATEREEGCNRGSSKKASRLPDHADLVGSDEYSQDIGGSCINLSTPNRTLDERNYKAIVRISDPDAVNYTLNKLDDGKFQLVGDNKIITREPVGLANPIRWQDTPDDNQNLTFYQSVTVATGHILHYKSEFRADGYSLGELLYSLPLAPGQKKQIVIFDSSHTLQAAESQTLSQGERLTNSLLNDRTIVDQLGGSFNETSQGRSSASTSGVSAGLGVGALGSGVGAVLGVSGGTSTASSFATQSSSRTISQYFAEKMHNLIIQNADSYRQQNASVVTTVQEGQHYAATTEVIANHNHCHAVTMMYFEVLRHYAIYQELANVEECLFVPLLMTDFSTENIYKWRDVLAKYLLPMPSNTYLQSVSAVSFTAQGISHSTAQERSHPLLKAFDANDRIRTNYKDVDFPSGAYDEEQISFVKGEIYLRTNLQRPKTRYDRIKSLPIVSKTITTAYEQFSVSETIKSAAIAVVTGGLSLLFGGGNTTETVYEEKEIKVRSRIFDTFMQLDANYESVLPAYCIRVTNFKIKESITINGIIPNTTSVITISGEDFFKDGINDENHWKAYATLLGYTNVLDMLNYYFKGKLIAEWDEIYYNDIAPIVFEKILDSITLAGISLDLTSSWKYKGGEQLMRINLNGTMSSTRKDLPLTITLGCGCDDTVKALKDLVTLTVGNIRIFYATPHYQGILYSGYVGDDLFDNTNLYIPENSDEKRNPRTEDRYLVDKLIEHLNSNIEYYNRALWLNLDANRRFMLLDGFTIQVFDDFGKPIGFRSLASVVKNELICVVGNSLVFPVAAGYRVSQSYITETTTEGVEEKVTLFDHYKPLTPIPPYRVSVPSRGAFMESIQGACDACEKVKENSSQDWTKFTTDEPTPIAPVTTPVPTITDWKAAFKDFAPPIVNIQNAPAAPAPGEGLAGLSELLGKSGIFKDITGLDANQQNAIKTYLSNQENAKVFADMAKNMSMQGHNTTYSDKIMDSLKSAKDSGAISQDDYSKMVKEHLQQQIDGGESKKAELESAKPVKPTLTDAAVKAVDQGKEVKAQKTDNEGNVESVEIRGNPSKVLAEVSGVPILKQPNDEACWATAATMMVSWKELQDGRKMLSIPDVLARAGDKYVKKFNKPEALKNSELHDFISPLNMVSEQFANYPLEKYIYWLNTYGPIWITTDAVVTKGIFQRMRVFSQK